MPSCHPANHPRPTPGSAVASAGGGDSCDIDIRDRAKTALDRANLPIRERRAWNNKGVGCLTPEGLKRSTS